jgi:hypothetical protein
LPSPFLCASTHDPTVEDQHHLKVQVDPEISIGQVSAFRKYLRNGCCWLMKVEEVFLPLAERAKHGLGE